MWRRYINPRSTAFKILAPATALFSASTLYCYVFHVRRSYKRDPSYLNPVKDAIWDESNKTNFNYESALYNYINALKALQRKKDPLSEPYTRIELKIAQMFENLGMYEEAHSIYLEMLYRFFNALVTPSKIPDDERPDFLRKDLRILIKSLEINKDVELGKKNLLAHLLLAQEEVMSRSPELKKFFDDRKEMVGSDLKSNANLNLNALKDILNLKYFKTVVNDENIKLDDNGHMILDIEKKSSAWEPFKEEFFTARDLYTAFCLSSHDVGTALSCKMTTLEWMVMADMPPGQILLSQANVGSLLYLQAEKYEAEIEKLKERLHLNNEKITTLGEEFKKMSDDNIITKLRSLNKNKDTCLKMANECYDNIIEFSKKNRNLKYHMKDQLDPAISQAIALSTYGKGVLNLHDGVLSKAEKLLKDSITLAKETDFIELLKEAEGELERTNILKEKQIGSSNN
ncbi:Mgr3p NDAI_0H02700 [Naumovozyma dairenensis CBS 421]|uniref:Mitochondrial inner membrane i-AAA protease supercomplex subunit MGR3 n=1 Tax=Naumovozyma dairenensis (strain ATCC 10597 / BCRC 20456 / CBS 421 / NBRC 0211 / NRRL Y-12639) TaxID=1071378 RepID=G0WF83_NAUDC|nr:hypothetical protein NDAI_0H02700 [Naumovozyma dairenensis CBS 421]CCD26444.1 hypothetical protein NDAI_0H02700 [Naumovozyma dairenensis CBS 421]